MMMKQYHFNHFYANLDFQMGKIKDDDIKDDFMMIENYDNPDNSLDLKTILEHMLEMKKIII